MQSFPGPFSNINHRPATKYTAYCFLGDMDVCWQRCDEAVAMDMVVFSQDQTIMAI